MEKQPVIGSDKPRATTRARVRAFADRERDDHPHLIPNLAPNLSKVPFISTTSLNSVSVSLMFRTWDQFGAEKVLYVLYTPRIYDNAAPRLPNRRVARILWWPSNEKELVPGFLGGLGGGAPYFQRRRAYNVGTYKKSILCLLFYFFYFNPFLSLLNPWVG
jgi:hypothetical protein